MIGTPGPILFSNQDVRVLRQVPNNSRGSGPCCITLNSSRFPSGTMVLLIPLVCVQPTDKFPLQTFLQGIRIPEHTGGEKCALDSAHICLSCFQFGGKDTRCCQLVAHPSGGVMFLPAPRGWCRKRDVSLQGSSTDWV